MADLAGVGLFVANEDSTAFQLKEGDAELDRTLRDLARSASQRWRSITASSFAILECSFLVLAFGRPVHETQHYYYLSRLAAFV